LSARQVLHYQKGWAKKEGEREKSRKNGGEVENEWRRNGLSFTFGFWAQTVLVLYRSGGFFQTQIKEGPFFSKVLRERSN
jgi:hypothetical protein